MKNDKNMIKKCKKNDKKIKKTRGKLQFSIFREKFCTAGSKNDET